jgi:ER-bound oxygenase mpaB/B'/Rubber oxygenase, catalytic domain
MIRNLMKKYPQDCFVRRDLYGQVLFGAPFSNPSKKSSGGRCIFDEFLLETYYRQRGDEMLDNVLELYHQEQRDVSPSWDLIAYGIHIRSSTEPPSSPADRALVKFLNYYSQTPDWLEAPRLRRGQQIFIRYLPAIGAALYYRSLVPGFSLPKIAAVLRATAYLAPPASATQVRTRLMDTGAFLAHIATASPSDEPEVWQIVLQVRLLHAKVRFALRHRQEDRASSSKEPWNSNLYGVPINQEDLAATLLAFSYNSLLGIEFVLGTPLSMQDQEDFLHFWRHVGWLLGVETAQDLESMKTAFDRVVVPEHSNTPFPPLDPCGPGWIEDSQNPLEHGYAMFASILLHLSKPDATSVQIAHHLLRLGRRTRDNPQSATISKEDLPYDMWFYFRSYQCRRFVGHGLANALLLPYHPVWWKRYQIEVYSTIYLLLLRLYTWASVPSSPIQWILYRWHERNLFKFVQGWRSTKFRKIVFPPGNASLPGSEEYSSHGRNPSSSCPFAMVAPPQY